MMRGIAPFEWKGSGTTGAPARRRLLDRNRIRRRKGVLEGFVERLFLAPALIAIAIVLMRFAFRIGNHFGFLDSADKDLSGLWRKFRCVDRRALPLSRRPLAANRTHRHTPLA